MPEPIAPSRARGAIGQWRREDPTARLGSRYGYPVVFVRREDGMAAGDVPTFEVDLYDANMMMRASRVMGSRYILTHWPEVLAERPARIEAPAEASPPAEATPPLPTAAQRRGARVAMQLLTMALCLSGGTHEGGTR